VIVKHCVLRNEYKRKSHTKSTSCPFIFSISFSLSVVMVCSYLTSLRSYKHPHKCCGKTMVQNPNHSPKSLAFISSLWPLGSYRVLLSQIQRERQRETDNSPNYEKYIEHQTLLLCS